MCNYLGALLLLVGSVLMVIAAVLLALDGWTQSCLVQIIILYFRIAPTELVNVQRYVTSLPMILLISGVTGIIGLVIWSASPGRPHRGAEFFMVVGKFIIGFGAVLATLPVATMLFGVWGFIILGGEGSCIDWLLHSFPHVILPIISLVVICIGSYYGV